jgi:hypothetical protein
MRESRQAHEPLGRCPVTLYLDQSDISVLALSREDTTAAHRSRLRTLTTRGDVRLRVSIAHFIESPKLSFRRLGAIHRFLAEIPHTVYARSYPADILRVELTGEHVDLRDHPVTALGIREVLRIACTVGVFGPFAEQIAYSKNQIKTILHFQLSATNVSTNEDHDGYARARAAERAGLRHRTKRPSSHAPQ